MTLLEALHNFATHLLNRTSHEDVVKATEDLHAVLTAPVEAPPAQPPAPAPAPKVPS